MTDELLAACRGILKYLKTSTDLVDTSREALEKRVDLMSLPRAEQLRLQADEIEEEEAAIWRFRKALADVESAIQ